MSKVAACACRALKVTVEGEPLQVYACSCLECQRASGSVFTYAACYPASRTRIEGEFRNWRRSSDSGRWVETSFCPTCGTPILGRVEAWADVVLVSAGCFADPSFRAPTQVFWASRKHHWLSLPEGAEALEEQ